MLTLMTTTRTLKLMRFQKWHEAEFGSDDEPDDAEADDKPS